MSNITIATTANWTKEYLTHKFDDKGIDVEIVVSDLNIDLLFNQLRQGDFEAFVYDFSTFPVFYPEDILITALSERFSNAYEVLIPEDIYQEKNIINLPLDAQIYLEDDYLKTALNDISNTFSFINSKEAVTILPSYYSEKSIVNNTNKKSILLNIREFPPKAAQGVLAYICNKNDLETRRTLKNVHHKEVTTLTNVEREFVKISSLFDAGVHCEKDKMNNYHLWVRCFKENELINIRASSSTTFGLAETAFEKYKNY